KDIFNPYMMDSNRSGTTNTGLDLYICKKLVQLHEGEINFHSEKNEGLVFTLTFPLLSEVEFVNNVSEMDSEEIEEIRHLLEYNKRENDKANIYPPNQTMLEKVAEANILIVDNNQLHEDNIYQ